MRGPIRCCCSPTEKHECHYTGPSGEYRFLVEDKRNHASQVPLLRGQDYVNREIRGRWCRSALVLFHRGQGHESRHEGHQEGQRTLLWKAQVDLIDFQAESHSAHPSSCILPHRRSQGTLLVYVDSSGVGVCL